MDINDVSIVTMTWARDEQEELLLRESLSYLAEFNIPTFITDGGSGQQFIDFLHNFPHFSIFEAEAPGVWSQIKQSIRAAAELNTKFILYTESDKSEFFQNSLGEFISEAPREENVGAVLASRSASSFATFPEFQQFTETVINRCCAEVVGHPFDFSYGPFLLNRNIIRYLNFADNNIGWGWRLFAFGMTHRLGLRIESIEKDLSCPLTQREDDKTERIYRMKQLNQSVQGVISSASVPLPDAE